MFRFGSDYRRVGRSGDEERGILENGPDLPISAQPSVVEDRDPGLMQLNLQKPRRAEAGRVSEQRSP